MHRVLGLIIVVLIVVAKSVDLPSHFKSCDRHSSNFLKCLDEAVAGAIVSMARGSKSLRVPPLEPLSIGDVTIGSNGGPVSLEQTFNNAKLYGLTKGFRIEHDTFDLDKLVIQSTSYNDQVDFVADYRMNGKVLILPITGKGRSNVTMIGLKVKSTVHLETFDKDGETYLRVKKYENVFEPTKVLLNFSNLFNDPIRSEQMNKFLNENSMIVFNETKGEYEETFALIFAKIASDLYSRVPLKKIFPE